MGFHAQRCQDGDRHIAPLLCCGPVNITTGETSAAEGRTFDRLHE